MAKTSIPQVTIHNVETGEVIIRDANAEELAQIETDKATFSARQAEAEAKAAEKSALLARLGLTEDELKTILG
jgi:hypothetical protein